MCALVASRRALLGRGAWTPLRLPGLALYGHAGLANYQDSARTTLVTAAGDPVGGVLDQSGHNTHFAQATSTKRFTLRQVTANGKTYYAWELDGVDDTLSAVGVALASDAATVWVVASVTAATNFGMFVAYGTSAGGDWNLRQVALTGRLSLVKAAANTGAGASGSSTPAGTTSNLAGRGWHLLTGKATAGDTWTITEDGTQQDSVSLALTQTTSNTVTVGTRSDGFPLQGLIAEIGIVDGAISVADQSRLSAYASREYGFVVAV